MKKAFTLIELLVVFALFTLIFGWLMIVFVNSDKTWQVGEGKLIEQKQARRAVNNIVSTLRQSSQEWSVNGTLYPLAISVNNTRIDFYNPVLNNTTGNISSLQKVTYKLDPSNLTHLLKKVGTLPESIIATSVKSIDFTCGCSGCTAVGDDCPVVRVSVVCEKNAEYNLTSEVTLRNGEMPVSDDVVVEEPEQGEF